MVQIKNTDRKGIPALAGFSVSTHQICPVSHDFRGGVVMHSPIPYVGGKSKLAKRIVERLPEHKAYCEVFSGAAWVFFAKPKSTAEIINDLDSSLITFYKCVKNHPEEFLRQFDLVVESRELFESWKHQLSDPSLTDIQRAARFYYVQRLAFGGRVNSQTYGVQADGRNGRIRLDQLKQEVDKLHRRLSKVRVENLSWEEFIPRYDSETALFYCDPPYYHCKDYKYNFERDDFVALSEALSKIKGKFILSINNHPDIQEIFKDFYCEMILTRYSICRARSDSITELLFSNFKPKKQLTLFSA